MGRAGRGADPFGCSVQGVGLKVQGPNPKPQILNLGLGFGFAAVEGLQFQAVSYGFWVRNLAMRKKNMRSITGGAKD